MLFLPDLRDWLPADHLAWFVLDVVDEIDITEFLAAYRQDGWGRAAFDPAMMVACANQVSDHATIARFRVRHEQALSDLFSSVLELCS